MSLCSSVVRFDAVLRRELSSLRSGDSLELRWVNHASFILSQGDVRLICDPWWKGLAFDGSWALLSPSDMRAEDLSTVTHMWFSHEHPDHFSPPTLADIPPEIRRDIAVLYQRTSDRKVLSYCRDLGFGRLVELPPGEWHALDEQVDVLNMPFSGGDSWLAVRMGEKVLLNLNDCVADTEEKIRAIRDRVGRVDVLLTQFSYACWAGNPEDGLARRRLGQQKLERIRLQARILKPRFVIPFASFVWFCHEENLYMNDEAVRVDVAADFVRRETAASPVVLYPGDTWQLCEPHDNGAAIGRYLKDYERVRLSEPLTRSAPVPLSELEQHAARFAGQLAESRSSWLSRFAEPARIYVTDHGLSLEFSLNGLHRRERPRAECDLALSSAALDYAFRFLWGGDTLNVNGRFACPSGGRPQRFMLYAGMASQINRGEATPLRTLARAIVARGLRATPGVRGLYATVQAARGR